MIAVLAVGADGDEVLDHRRGQHARGQRPAVRVESEHDDFTFLQRTPQVDLLARRPRIEPVPNVGFGEDRQSVTRAGQVALLLGSQRV